MEAMEAVPGRRPAGWPSTARRPRLRRELAVTLAIKTALLFGLWWLFFSQAPSKPDIARDIGNHLAGPSRAAAGIADPSPAKEQQP